MKIPANLYALGADVVCSVTFKNAASVIADPDVVRFEFKNPNGDVTNYLYGTDAAVVKDSTGVYHVNVDGNAEGTWYYRFFATGTGKAADEGSFIIQPSQFAS